METLESREAGLEHTSTRWGRTLAVGSAAWAALVLCRTAARLIAVGSGQRTVLELLLLTASVNAYWLVAVPAMLWLRTTARANTSRGWFIVATLGAAVAVILAEPLWYRIALSEFRGDPLPWAEAVLSRGDINTLIVILALVGAWVAESYATARLRQRQHDVLESTLVDAELRALTLQLQPHFLFNTLQLAAEAAYDDLGAARRIVADLQTLLRRSFAFEEQRLVTVADEVDFLESYVAIQQRRFGARLSVRIEVDDEARARAVPPLLLQPLVENSIQHGVGRLARDGEIVVRIRARGPEELAIEVRDNGVGFSAHALASQHGLGLGVTRRRLRALYGDRGKLVTETASHGGAVVFIVLPAAASRDATTLKPTRRRRRDGGHEPLLQLSKVGLLALAALFVAANIAVSGSALERLDGMPVRFGALSALAMWLPLQILVAALIVILWRARSVRAWLARRDSDARVLRSEIDAARARVATLRVGKDTMLDALDQLAAAQSAVDFDRVVVDASNAIRSCLARASEPLQYDVSFVPASACP